MNCTFPVAKTEALISFAVTAKLICAFVFAHANCWFSHAGAHLTNYGLYTILKLLVQYMYMYILDAIFGHGLNHFEPCREKTRFSPRRKQKRR